MGDGSVSGIDATIGRTPTVKMRAMAKGLPGSVVVKLESRNPGGSVKDRIARGMIDDAERHGLLSPGVSVIVEPTSGNTGIALAMIGAARGYRVVLTMPESMSLERRRLLQAYGAELVLTPAAGGMAEAVAVACEIVDRTEHAFMPAQFDNPANPRSHYETTGPEIERALSGATIGALVVGVGTGGTVSGAGRYLKERLPHVWVVAVEPAESPLIAQTRAGAPLTPSPHIIQGMGANFVPATLDLGVLDEVIAVDGETALVHARRLAAEEGVLGGISSGANVAAALAVASRPEMQGRAVVTVAPSTGERYLSTRLWEEFAR